VAAPQVLSAAGHPEWLLGKVAEHGGQYALERPLRVFTEAPDFFDVAPYDVMHLAGRYYLIRGHEFEGRFGLEETPKYWVKRAIDLETGEKKILKFVFHETFTDHLGSVTVKYVRSPEKEARVLAAVRGHPNFMQGFPVIDPSGHNIRIIDRIPGKPLDHLIDGWRLTHEVYFHEKMPGVLQNLVTVFEAMGFLHRAGEKHGDIRRDHILVEHSTGTYKWIDFDLDYYGPEHPFGVDIFGLGNVLLYAVGMGIHTVSDIHRHRPEVFKTLYEEDTSLVLSHRVCNLRKLFPYVPVALNNILLHFSLGADVFYESVDELLYDLRDYLAR